MARKSKPPRDFFRCPACGARVPVGAVFCRECGASDDSGWGGEEPHVHSDIPYGYDADEDFDYDEFVRREFPQETGRPFGWTAKQWIAAIIIAMIVVALILAKF